MHVHFPNWWIRFFAADPHQTHGYFGHLVFGVLLVLAILGLLQALPRPFRKPVVAIFTFLGGIYFFVEFFWPASPKTHDNWLSQYEPLVSNIATVLGSFSIGIGVVSVLQVHAKRIAQRAGGWGNSIALLVSMVAMCAFHLWNKYAPNRNLMTIGHSTITPHKVYDVLFNGGLVPLGAATFSLIGFYIASAAYRAFRARSVESSLLMGAALIVMLATTTLGEALTSWIPNGESPLANLRIEHIAEWILNVVNTPAQRGIVFGLEAGAMAVSLRYWLSLEKGAYFDKEI